MNEQPAQALGTEHSVVDQGGGGMFVGLDWASRAHELCVVDEQGAVVADNSRHASPWAERVYRDARARGCRHPHAVRILARAWLRIIWACWHNETLYDPNRRQHPHTEATLT